MLCEGSIGIKFKIPTYLLKSDTRYIRVFNPLSRPLLLLAKSYLSTLINYRVNNFFRLDLTS